MHFNWSAFGEIQPEERNPKNFRESDDKLPWETCVFFKLGFPISPKISKIRNSKKMNIDKRYLIECFLVHIKISLCQEIPKNVSVNKKIKFIQNASGGILAPFDSWLVIRGIETLTLRVRQHSENAQKVAEYLLTEDFVKTVYYPGLSQHKNHVIAKQQSKYFGGVISFDLKIDDKEFASKIVSSIFYWLILHFSIFVYDFYAFPLQNIAIDFSPSRPDNIISAAGNAKLIEYCYFGFFVALYFFVFEKFK